MVWEGGKVVIDGYSNFFFFPHKAGACFYCAVSTGPFTTEGRKKWRLGVVLVN